SSIVICPWACSCGGEKCWWTGDGSSKVCSNGAGSVSGIGVGVGMDAGVGVGVGGEDCTGGDDVGCTGSVDDDG
ncbi:hypothetical protein Tco_0582419, partial [Tanacetum coccineum]